MKIQDILLLAIGVILVLFYRKKPELLIVSGIVCIIMAMPLLYFWIFFTAQHLIYFAFFFILFGTILIACKKQ